MRRKLFRREWIFPALAVGFVSASAHATRDELSAQAAGELHCNSVSVIPSGTNEFLATGCGRDLTYTCDEEGTCTSNAAATVTPSKTTTEEDDAAAEAVASALTDMACACASAGLASHGSHSSHSSSSRHAHAK